MIEKKGCKSVRQQISLAVLSVWGLISQLKKYAHRTRLPKWKYDFWKVQICQTKRVSTQHNYDFQRNPHSFSRLAVFIILWPFRALSLFRIWKKMHINCLLVVLLNAFRFIAWNRMSGKWKGRENEIVIGRCVQLNMSMARFLLSPKNAHLQSPLRKCQQ